MSADKHFTPRHKARAIVLQCLYEIDVAGHPVDEVLEQNLARVRLTPELMGFVRSLVRSVREQVPRLDELIGPRMAGGPAPVYRQERAAAGHLRDYERRADAAQGSRQ